MSVAVVAVVPVASVLPVNATDCGLPGALSVNDTVPPSKKDDDGEGSYLTLTVQLAPGARLAPQVVAEITKSVLTRIALAGNVTAVLPVLVSVIVCGKLIVPAG